ncbi:MAG: hypothetical protein ACQEXJ_22005 [Myxococcota bacterium]
MRREAAAMLATALLVGCGSDDGGGAPSADATADATPDTGADVAPDGAEDAGPDGDSDTPPDPGPTWSTCPDEPLATEESLAEKAASYDDIAARLHVHPDLKWITNVDLERVEVDCPAGVDGPCWEPAVPESEATWEDVARWHTGENDGLWSALYLTSQAYRHAVTGSEEALANIRLLLEGEVARMEVTGVPGVFTRQFIPPGVDGIACPEGDAQYTTDPEKDDNQWVRIDQDGCARVVDHETGEWTTTDHCISEEFAGYCWLDNVSQDEYGGHMLALAAVARLVDVPDVQATVRDLAEKVAVHLMEHDLTFVDWDGRVTEHGKLYATSFYNTPGFLAAEALAWVGLGVVLTDRADLGDFYRGCLIQDDDRGKCLDHLLEDGTPYTEHLPAMGLYAGQQGCKSNFNNFSMSMSSLQVLIWTTEDPDLRDLAQQVMDEQVVNYDGPRAVITHDNAWYNLMWAAFQPEEHAPAEDAVETAVCMLRQFPASQALRAEDSAALYEDYCEGRLGDSQAEEPIPPAHRCTETFLWWNGTFTRHSCDEAPWVVHQPGDYLLPYWMGRYHGFIPADL